MRETGDSQVQELVPLIYLSDFFHLAIARPELRALPSHRTEDVSDIVILKCPGMS